MKRIVSIIFFQVSLLSQLTGQEIRELRIGQKVPELKFSVFSDPGFVERKLSYYKQKLVILDFWATWCGSCLGTFPKLNALQNKFKKNLQLILVNSAETGDSKKKITDFIAKRERSSVKVSPFTIAVEDKVASMYFPHTEIPHYVWISPAGNVLAITGSEEVTVENVEKAIKGEQIEVFAKRDFFPDRISGICQSDIIIDDSLIQFSVFRKGYDPEWKPVNSRRRITVAGEGETKGILMRNISLLEMYQTALSYDGSWSIINHDPKRFIIEIGESSKLISDFSKTELDNWQNGQIYTYDLVIPSFNSSKLSSIILNDLNNYSMYYGRIERRKQKFFKLIELQDTIAVALSPLVEPGCIVSVNSDSLTIKHGRTGDIVKNVNIFTDIKFPIIDQTKGMFLDIVLTINIKNTVVADLRKLLRSYGLDLIESIEEIDMFVLSKKY